MFTLIQIKAAHAVAEQGSFRKAAVLLGVSQSTLSRTIQQLEDETGLRLFERDRQSVAVTSEGRILLDLTRDLLHRAAEVDRRLRRIGAGHVELLRVGVGPIVAQTWIGSALREFSRISHGQAVEVEELRWWEMADVLKQGLFDMIIGEYEAVEDDPAIVIERLPHRAACFVVRAGHKLASLDSPTMADIAAYPNVGPRLPARRLAALPTESGMGRISDDGQFFLPRIECSQLRTMLDVVAGSDAFCATFDQIVANSITDGSLHVLSFRPEWLRTRYGIMHMRDRRPTKAATDFQATAVVAERRYFEESCP